MYLTILHVGKYSQLVNLPFQEKRSLEGGQIFTSMMDIYMFYIISYYISVVIHKTIWGTMTGAQTTFVWM